MDKLSKANEIEKLKLVLMKKIKSENDDRYKDLSSDEIMKIIIESSNNGKYVLWVLREYLKGNIQRFEDMPRVKQALILFKNNLSKFTEQQKQLNKMSFQELENLVEPYQDVLTQNAIKRMNKEKIWSEIDVIYSGPEGKIYVPKTEQAAIFLGQGTKWCTAATTNNMFESYNKQGPLYVLITPEKDEMGREMKYQLHLETWQLMDAEDKPAFFTGNLINKISKFDFYKSFATLKAFGKNIYNFGLLKFLEPEEFYDFLLENKDFMASYLSSNRKNVETFQQLLLNNPKHKEIVLKNFFDFPELIVTGFFHSFWSEESLFTNAFSEKTNEQNMNMVVSGLKKKIKNKEYFSLGKKLYGNFKPGVSEQFLLQDDFFDKILNNLDEEEIVQLFSFNEIFLLHLPPKFKTQEMFEKICKANLSRLFDLVNNSRFNYDFLTEELLLESIKQNLSNVKLLGGEQVKNKIFLPHNKTYNKIFIPYIEKFAIEKPNDFFEWKKKFYKPFFHFLSEKEFYIKMAKNYNFEKKLKSGMYYDSDEVESLEEIPFDISVEWFSDMIQENNYFYHYSNKTKNDFLKYFETFYRDEILSAKLDKIRKEWYSGKRFGFNQEEFEFYVNAEHFDLFKDLLYEYLKKTKMNYKNIFSMLSLAKLPYQNDNREHFVANIVKNDPSDSAYDIKYCSTKLNRTKSILKKTINKIKPNEQKIEIKISKFTDILKSSSKNYPENKINSVSTLDYLKRNSSNMSDTSEYLELKLKLNSFKYEEWCEIFENELCIWATKRYLEYLNYETIMKYFVKYINETKKDPFDVSCFSILLNEINKDNFYLIKDLEHPLIQQMSKHHEKEYEHTFQIK